MATIVNKLKTAVRDRVPAILEAVFQCTLEMITVNFEDYPEHRLQFYFVLEAVNKHCFQVLFAIPEEVFKVFVDAVVWAMKHTDRDISEVGLTILQDLLKNISGPECPGGAAGAFYQKFFVHVMSEVFAVLTDKSHKPGFKMQCEILATMFNLVETGMITVPLFDQSAHPPGTSNSAFLRQHLANLFAGSFPNLARGQVERFVVALFEKNSDSNAFKTLLRDFLVTLKEFGTDNDELWSEEKEFQKQQMEAAMPAALRTVNAAAQADEDAAMSEL
jgi:exportin-1